MEKPCRDQEIALQSDASKWCISAEEAGLRPCPHCGLGNSIVSIVQDHLGYWRVFCGACGSSSGTLLANERFPDAKERIVAIWNKRADQDEIANTTEDLIDDFKTHLGEIFEETNRPSILAAKAALAKIRGKNDEI